MNKKEFDEKYVGEKIAVNCKTKELAIEFLGLASSFFYGWLNSNSFNDYDKWETYKENTCYSLDFGQFANIAYYKREGYTIVEFETLKDVELRYYEMEVGEVYLSSDYLLYRVLENCSFEFKDVGLGSLWYSSKNSPKEMLELTFKKVKTEPIKYVSYNKAFEHMKNREYAQKGKYIYWFSFCSGTMKRCDALIFVSNISGASCEDVKMNKDLMEDDWILLKKEDMK